MASSIISQSASLVMGEPRGEDNECVDDSFKLIILAICF